jgi:AcrR family transcriptional regulator
MSDSTQVHPKSPEAPRRRQRRKDARPQEIVEAAMRLWAEKGYAATRLDDVAAEAGVAKGTIYLYFASKEALFEAALRQTLVATMESAGGLTEGFGGNTRELLAMFFGLVHRQLEASGAVVLIKVLIGEGHRFPALVTLHREIALSRGTQTLMRILQRGVERGELRSDAARTDPRIIMGPIMTAALWSLVYKDATFPPIQSLIEQHVEIIAKGLATD